MKILNLQIKNFRNLKNIDLDLSTQNGLSVLIGNNGSGKSNLLECISSIFKNLYTEKKDFESEFAIRYKLFDNNEIYISYIQGSLQQSQNVVYPKRVIAIYSGEEQRMWKKYYQPIYENYISNINHSLQVGAFPSMLFLNKFYWNVALLSLLCSDSKDNETFIKDVLGINNVNNIHISIDEQTYKNYQESPILSFVKQLAPKQNYTVEEFKDIINAEQNVIDSSTLFCYLYIAFTSKTNKIIDEINITFNNSLSIVDLSEGQKKLLLIKAALEFAGAEDTLYLLDEPDAHIHVANKSLLIDILKLYSANRQIILTSHSPSVINCTTDHVTYIENGIVKDMEIVNMISQLTNKQIGYIDGPLILSSKKPLILVEGKGDVDYINKAIEILSRTNPKYTNISWDILYMGGAGKNAKQFINTIKPHINIDKQVLVIFDRDESGKVAMKDLVGHGNRDDNKTYRQNNWYYLMLPKTKEHSGTDFTIEDYFPILYKQHIVHEKLNATNWAFKELPTDLRQNIKDALGKHIDKYQENHLAQFSVLLDKIINILNGTDADIEEI